MKLNAISKIHKYRRFHEEHHFIQMTMEVHNTPMRNMDHFIMKCVHLFHNKQSGGHLSFSIYIQFFKQHVNISFQRVLASAVEKEIVLASDMCSRPAIIIRLHDCV